MTARLSATLSARVGRLALEVSLETAGTLVLVGPNGAGKSSLLAMLLGTLPAAGRIAVGDAVLLDSARGVSLPLEERRLGWVPQDYALFPHLSVRDNLAFAVGSAGPPDAARIDRILAELGLTTLADRRPRTLSGGEQQRLALARALSVAPRALLLDEPLAALDVHARREVRAFLAGWLRTVALPTLVVTHDPADAIALGDRIAVLEEGRLVQSGTWAELRAKPASRFVEEFTAGPEPAR